VIEHIRSEEIKKLEDSVRLSGMDIEYIHTGKVFIIAAVIKTAAVYLI